MSGLSLADIAIIIGRDWDVDNEVLEVLKVAFDKTTDIEIEDINIAKFLHLLTFYELSKGKMLESGLNNFIDFDIDFVSDIYEDFNTIVGVGS